MQQIIRCRCRATNHELLAGNSTRVIDTDVVHAEMNARGASRERNVEPAMNDHGNIECRDECPRRTGDCARALVRQTKLDHRRAATAAGTCAMRQPLYTVTEVVGDSEQSQRLGVHNEALVCSRTSVRTV